MINPWLERFHGVTDLGRIRSHVQNIPDPPIGLLEAPPAVAGQRLRTALDSLLIVTDQVGQVIRRVLYHAWQGSDLRYADRDAILRHCYGEQCTRPITPPLCLMGHAGVGKTKILGAAAALLPDGPMVKLADGHCNVPLRGFIGLTVEPRDSDASLIQCIARKLDIDSGRARERETLKGVVQRIAYRDGLAGINMDEFQHATLSAANSRITGLLLTCRNLGVPLTYACNFSMGHRLAKRPQEDRDRLLANVAIFHRERPDSMGWAEIVAGTLSVLGPYGRMNDDGLAGELGQLSGCLPRNLHRLIAAAFELARERQKSFVSVDDLRSAYGSRAYASARVDIEALNRIANGSDARNLGRPDLFCPDEFVQDDVCGERPPSEQERLNAVARLMLEQSMTKDERLGLGRAKERAKHSAAQKVVSIRKSKGRSAQELLDGHHGYAPK